MSKRVVEHQFIGHTTTYDNYDPNKTVLGESIRQYSGPNSTDRFAGPMKIGNARPFESSVSIPVTYPHVVSWANKSGYYSTGTVAVNGLVVTGDGTAWLTDGVPMRAKIGFGSADPLQITTWYTIDGIISNTILTIEISAGTIPAETPFVIDKNYQIDWVFLADIATAATTRRIVLYEYNRNTSVFNWRGFITLTYPVAGNKTIAGMRAIYNTYTTGTVTVASSDNYSTGTASASASTTITGSGTTWTTGMIGMSIGFYTTNPANVNQWFVITARASNTSITINTAVTVAAGSSYVIATTTVTGDGTAWNDVRVAVGSRIGFGSTDPTQISQWHYVSALTPASVVDSNTSMYIQSQITPTGTGGTTSNIVYPPGTPYVIEDLKVLTAVTNATATSGGLFIMNGLSWADFAVGGTTTVAATTLDKAKVVYWLADADTVTNTIASGLALDDFQSWTEQYCYIINRTAATTPQVYKYNFRAPLASISSGKTTSAFVLKTGTQGVVGNISQINNGRIGILNHGPGAGVKCLYFVTASRICRAVVADITSDSTNWYTDAMVEIPPGSITTFSASSVINSVEIANIIDRLIITCTNARSYVTRYNTSADPFDHIFLIDSKQIDQASADSRTIPHPATIAVAITVWSERGIVYLARPATTAVNAIYAVPLSVDWDYANNTVKQRLITPAISTPEAIKYSRLYFNQCSYLGVHSFTLPTEPVRAYYRTIGINDDSGSWTPVDKTGDLSMVDGATAIQFCFEFRMIGTFCLPNRIYNVAVAYEDNSTDSHYQPSVAHSSTADKQFAWRFSTAFGNSVPILRIRIYEAVEDGLLLDDNTEDQSYGVFQKSTDGGQNWGDYNTDDKTNENTYIRYIPNSLPDDIKVRALLTQA